MPPPPVAGPPPPTAPAEPGHLVRQFGQASLAAPLVSMALACLTRNRMHEGGATALILLIVVSAMPIFGLTAAVVALAGIRRHGIRGLLVPGLLGLILNGGMVAGMVSVFLRT